MTAGVFLNIERIVLYGCDHIDRHELAAALQQALMEQLASTEIGHSGATPSDRIRITLPESFSATQLGQSLASDLCSVIRNAGAAGTAGRDSEHGAEPNA